MADNNEKLEKDLQGQEADIEVDVTNDVAEEEKVVEQPKAEAAEEEVKKEDEGIKEEVQEEPVEDTEKKPKEEVSEEPKQEEEKHNEDEQPKQEEPADESEPDDKDDSDDKAEVDDVADEPSEKERELMAQIETYKEAEQLRELAIMKHQAETQLDDTTNQVHDALIKTIKKYEIPEDKTLNELRAESPEKAAILEGLLTKAQEVIQTTSAKLSAQVEEKAKEVLFDKAGKMFDAYKMTEEQANIAAATFINIMNQVGINDLGEDLAAKVKLSVAQAKMDSPDVVEVAPVQEDKKVIEVEENKKEKPVQKSEEDIKDEVPPAEEDKVPPAEEKVEDVPPAEEKKPDLSEFMEGVEGNAAKASDINTDNVLAKLNALPFKERTKFYKENMDLINEAMKKARGQAQ